MLFIFLLVIYFMPVPWRCSLKRTWTLNTWTASSLTFPRASGQWLGHVDTTASYRVHISVELDAACTCVPCFSPQGSALWVSVLGRKCFCSSKKMVNIQASKERIKCFLRKSSEVMKLLVISSVNQVKYFQAKLCKWCSSYCSIPL